MRKRHEERLQQDDGFPKASIQVIVSRVHCLPPRPQILCTTVDDLLSGGAKIVIEVIHHLTQRAELGEKLGAFAEEHPAEQAANACRALAPGPLKIGGIEGSGIGNSSVMFGVI